MHRPNGRRLTAQGFTTVLSRLRADEEFRSHFLAGQPGSYADQLCDLDPEDRRRLASIVWSRERKNFEPFDEKLVLCSSSGY